MKIAIFGSWSESRKKWRSRESKEKFIEACRIIGREISRCGHAIIVNSSDPNTADRYVVEGAVEEVENKEIEYPIINVLRHSDGFFPFKELARKYSNIFSFYSRTQSWWEGAHLIAIRDADAILTICGGRVTYIAGLASIVAKKKLAPIGSFGGASEKLLQVLEGITSEIEYKNDVRRLNNPWNKEVLNTALKLLGIVDSPSILIIHGRGNDWKDLKDYLQNTLQLPKIIVMEEEFTLGKTLPEKFEYVASKVDSAIAVVTPDDVGTLKDREDFKLRTRQNVWLEIGWFWGRLCRERIMILCKEEVEIPSNIRGIEFYYYKEKHIEKSEQIRLFIKKIERGVV